MRKPITIAMTLSAGIHAALIILVTGSFERAEAPAITNEPLIVTLESAGIDAAAERPSTLGTDEPMRSDAAATPATEPEPESLAASDGASAAVPAEPAALPASRDGLEHPDVFEASVEPVALADLSLPGVAAMASDLTVQPPALNASVTTASAATQRTAPLTTKQQKMLARKIRDWAETYHKRDDPQEELTWKHNGQHYKASFTALPGGDDMSLDRLVIRVSTEEDGDLLSTELKMKRLAFSSFAQFVNRWDDSVQLHDDELDGRFHSNSAINLSYSRKVKPRFHGKVTTSARTINVTDRRGFVRRDQIFLGGVQTGVRSIRLPKNFVPLPGSADVFGEQVHEVEQDTRITFHEDGSYSWVSLESGLFERRGSIRKPAGYLIATGKAKLFVRGRVNGRVLLYSPERIVIEGDLVYARDPEMFPDSDDYIGLVSAKNIEIAGPEVTGPGDLRIHGAMYAKRRFSIKRFRSRGQGTLSIYGSLTAGSLSATEPRYATNIRFDPRLEALRPPGFPLTDRYELESWDSAWTVEEAL